MFEVSDSIQWAAHNYIFHPPQPRPALSDFKMDSHNVRLRTVCGDNVHCRLSTPNGSVCTLKQYTKTDKVIIFLHGNADDLSTCTSYADWLAQTQFCNVLSVDYPGYGYSDGSHNTTEDNMYHAAAAVLEFVTNTLKHEQNSVLIFGKSLGTVPAIQLSSQGFAGRILGLVLVSPLASGARCILGPQQMSMIPRKMMPFMDRLFAPSIDRIHDVECPIFVVHGNEDELVPVENAHALMSRCRTTCFHPPLFVEAGHNDIEAKFRDNFISGLQDFCGFCGDRVRSRSTYDED